MLSLAAQLAATHANTKPISALTFNQESNASEASRCTAAVWIPGSHGAVFASAHANGAVLLHQKIVGSSSDSKLLARSSPDQGSRAPPVQLRPPGGPGATALAASPLGKLLAVGSRDGTLALLELPSGKVIGGFKSYYGGILCATWSADGRYVAAGGEDDLVAVWSMAEGAVVAHCEGHASWVSGVAFDRYGAFAPFSGRSNTAGSAAAEGRYRLASVGQDCHVLLWDLGLGEPSLGTSSRGSSARSPIAASVPRAEMTLLAPVTQSKVHYEPLCDVVFLEDALVAAGHDGTVKRWRRPEAMPMADETEDIEPMAVE